MSPKQDIPKDAVVCPLLRSGVKGAEVERGIHQVALGKLEGAGLNLSVEVHRQLQAPMNRFEARHAIPQESSESR